jgi:hypothetical protein
MALPRFELLYRFPRPSLRPYPVLPMSTECETSVFSCAKKTNLAPERKIGLRRNTIEAGEVLQSAGWKKDLH